MNIFDLKLFKINIMASPFLLLNYFVERKYRCETTKHKTALEGLELLLKLKKNR